MEILKNELRGMAQHVQLALPNYPYQDASHIMNVYKA